MSHARSSVFWVICLLVLCGLTEVSPLAWALRKDGGNYAIKTKVGPDAQAGGWFINLGLTGARGKMMPEEPTQIEVAYIIEGTPADGVLHLGDRIIGAGGKLFQTPHKFGYGMDKFGYEGPMMDLGNAMDISQGPEQKGRLTLRILREGQPRDVTLQLPTRYGRYAPTYPMDCRKTDIVLEELYDYLIKRQREDGSWHGRPHLNAMAALALLAGGRPQDRPAIDKAMHYFAEQTNDQIDYRGYDCWKFGLYGVCLGEYYLATKQDWVLTELDEINRWLVKSQFTLPYGKRRGPGGWGHRPTNRPGGNGYGPFSMVTAQAMAAWGLCAQSGLAVDRERYQLAHEFLARGTNNIGYVWYADGNGGNDKYADLGRTGGAAVAHALNPFGDPAMAAYALKAAHCIAQNNNTFPDTHGSPILGMAWTALGAAIDPPSLRQLMDDHRWYFELAHCPDGTFYYQPNRDNNPQDFTAAPRLSASAAVALIYSIKHRSLRIMKPIAHQ